MQTRLSKHIYLRIPHPKIKEIPALPPYQTTPSCMTHLEACRHQVYKIRIGKHRQYVQSQGVIQRHSYNILPSHRHRMRACGGEKGPIERMVKRGIWERRAKRDLLWHGANEMSPVTPVFHGVLLDLYGVVWCCRGDLDDLWCSIGDGSWVRGLVYLVCADSLARCWPRAKLYSRIPRDGNKPNRGSECDVYAHLG